MRVSNVQLVILVAALGLAGIIGWWLRVTRPGLALRAIGVDPEVASIMGVDRRRLALLTMPVAGGLAGLAGVLLTYYLGSVAPETGAGFLLKAFAVIILGGVGSIAGVVVGAMILAGIETLVLVTTSGSWAPAIALGLIFLMLLVRPRASSAGRRCVARERLVLRPFDPHPGDVHQSSAGALDPGPAAAGVFSSLASAATRSVPTPRRSSPSGSR